MTLREVGYRSGARSTDTESTRGRVKDESFGKFWDVEFCDHKASVAV